MSRETDDLRVDVMEQGEADVKGIPKPIHSSLKAARPSWKNVNPFILLGVLVIFCTGYFLGSNCMKNYQIKVNDIEYVKPNVVPVILPLTQEARLNVEGAENVKLSRNTEITIHKANFDDWASRDDDSV